MFTSHSLIDGLEVGNDGCYGSVVRVTGTTVNARCHVGCKPLQGRELVNFYVERTSRCGWIAVGVVTEGEKENSWIVLKCDGTISYISNVPKNPPVKGAAWSERKLITMDVDTERGNIRFALDGKYQGIAFEGLGQDKFYVAVCLFTTGDRVAAQRVPCSDINGVIGFLHRMPRVRAYRKSRTIVRELCGQLLDVEKVLDQLTTMKTKRPKLGAHCSLARLR